MISQSGERFRHVVYINFITKTSFMAMGGGYVRKTLPNKTENKSIVSMGLHSIKRFRFCCWQKLELSFLLHSKIKLFFEDF